MTEYDPSVNLIPAKKGEVRNPNGRPKGTKNRATIMRQWLEMEIDGEPNIDKVMRALILKAADGDVPAIKEALDSAFGKNTDSLKLSGDEDNPINTSLTVRFVDGNDNPEGV